MARKVKHSETLQGFYRTRREAASAMQRARTLGLGAKIAKVDWGKKKYAVYIWLKH